MQALAYVQQEELFAEQPAQHPLKELEIARIVALDPQGKVAIRFAGRSEISLAMTVGELDNRCVGRRVAVMFLGGNPEQPLVIGLLKESNDAHTHDPKQRVSVEAQDALTLKCGESSLTLQSDGRLVLRAKNIASYATGTNRIRGATVELN